jgi:hypothetical protein
VTPVTCTARDTNGNTSSCTFNVTVVGQCTGTATLGGRVRWKDSLGRTRGPLAGATVGLSGGGIITTDGTGTFAFDRLCAGTYVLKASKEGYYEVQRTNTVKLGEMREETLTLTKVSTNPVVFDFASPCGKHFIPGLPGSLKFEATVAWNGTPGSVQFTVAGVKHLATLRELEEGQAKATLILPAPRAIAECSELTIEVTNGNNEKTEVSEEVYFYPIPEILDLWIGEGIPWSGGSTYAYSQEISATLWEFKSGLFSSSAHRIGQKYLEFDSVAGTLNESIGWGSTFSAEVKVSPVTYLGEGHVALQGDLLITLAGCDLPSITPGWTISAGGKAGLQAPAVVVVEAIFPTTGSAFRAARRWPPARSILDAIQLQLYLWGEGSVSGQYQGGHWGYCFLGATSTSGALSGGLEGGVNLAVRGETALDLGAKLGGTIDFGICPDFKFESFGLNGYVALTVSVWILEYTFEVPVNLPLCNSPDRLRLLDVSFLEGSGPMGSWQPSGNRLLRWGEANRSWGTSANNRGKVAWSPQNHGASEETIVENVTRLGHPALTTNASGAEVLFVFHDAQKPWHAATDMGWVRRTGAGQWSLNRITDDLTADFSPRIAPVDTRLDLAAWTRIAGDVSGATNPVQVAPHLEIVAAWCDRNTGDWSEPVQFTTNAVVDRDPVPVVFGAIRGILWIQNEGEADLGDATNGDRLVFATWAGDGWTQPQTLWLGPKGIFSSSFVADGAGEGHVVFDVDEDGNLDTRGDRELYLLSTMNGAWQPACRLTNDGVEDALPVLVAPKGLPICIWSASNSLVYARLDSWRPRPVYAEQTLANAAPTLNAVTLPGVAALAYAAQTPSGMDIFASFYDASLDRWSLPRQLTHDEHAESALSLACDGANLTMAYLKTLTVRTNLDIEINGQMQHLENIPQPGRTDLCYLRHTLGNDVAVVPGTLILDPPNPVPGSVATNRVIIENRGDLPVTNLAVVFYDGNPQTGGSQIGSVQAIPGPWVGGATQEVSVVWAVPANPRPHEIYVVVDPAVTLNEWDRANNIASIWTVLPDLAIATCWSTEVSLSSVALVARLTNAGVISAGPFEVSWHLGTVDGEVIGTNVIDSLAPGGIHEISYLWDTSGRQFTQPFVPAYAVVGAASRIRESDKSNNSYPQSVRVVPSWVPHLEHIEAMIDGTVRLVFNAANGVASDFAVESTESLANPIQWTTELGAMINRIEPGEFEAVLPRQGEMRFYRIGLGH